jgi:tetratricopeptide (TPR) repeat protein
MRSIPTLLLLISISFSAVAQVSMAKYFDYNLLPRADFQNYKEIPIQWNFDGKTQREFNSGLTALKEERHVQAIASFDEAVKLSPELWITYFYRGICLKILGRYEDALKDLEFARKNSGGRFEVSYEIGEIFQHQRAYSKALDSFEEARILAPDSVEGYYGIANIAFLNTDTEKAVRFYKKCMDVNPMFPDAYLKAGLLRLFINRRENKAFEYFDKAIEVSPDFQDGLFWRGLINIEFNRIDKAMLDWNKLIQLNPHKPLYTLVRGYLYIELDDYDKAFTDLKNSVLAFNIDETKFEFTEKSVSNKQIDLYAASNYLMRNIYGLTDEAAAPMRKAYCLIVKDEYKEALSNLDKSLKFEPSASAFLLKAITFEYLQQHDSSLFYLEKTLAIDNDIFEAHKKRAIYRSAVMDWRGATADFMAMQRIQPESMITFKLRGQLKAALNDHYGAIIDLTRYLKSDSFNVDILRLRANANLQVKNYKLYREDYKTLVELDTAELEYHQGYYIASMLLNDTLTAEEGLRKCAQKLPFATFPILQMMEIHLWRKNWAKALESYSTFENIPLKGAQNRSEGLYLKGLAHLGLNEIDLAFEAFDKSISEGKVASYVNLDAYYERGKLFLKVGKTKQAKSDFKVLKNNNFEKDQDLIEQVLKAD